MCGLHRPARRRLQLEMHPHPSRNCCVLDSLQPSSRIWWCRPPTLPTVVSTCFGAACQMGQLPLRMLLCACPAEGFERHPRQPAFHEALPSARQTLQLHAERTPLPMCLLCLLCRQCLRVHRGLRRLHPHPFQLLWLPPGGCQPRLLLPGEGWQVAAATINPRAAGRTASVLVSIVSTSCAPTSVPLLEGGRCSLAPWAHGVSRSHCRRSPRRGGSLCPTTAPASSPAAPWSEFWENNADEETVPPGPS